MGNQLMQIKKVSVKDDEPVFSYKKKEPGGARWFTVDNEAHPVPIHPDFRQGLDNLKIHLAILSGAVKEKEVTNPETPKPELIQDFNINGFTITGKEDDKVVITGTRKVPHGSVTINAPAIRMDGESENSYSFIDHLVATIHRLEWEAESYLDGTKRGTDPQQSLFENNNGVLKTEEVNEEAAA